MEYRIINVMSGMEDGHTKIIYIPRYIRSSDIESISPHIAESGRPYKNVTSLETYSNKQYIVIGNYKDHQEKLNKRTQVGYTKKGY